MQKRFIPPLSNCRICMDQSLIGFYRVGQKLSDVIPVLRITTRATEPSTISVFLSSVKCGLICRAQTCAHSGIEPSTLAKGFLQDGPKVRKKIEFLTISSLYVPYISVTAKNTGSLTSSVCSSFLIGTCEASRFYSNSNRTSRFDSIRKWRADSKISNRRACHVCRRTINNTHCSTTNFNRFGNATGIYIEFN